MEVKINTCRTHFHKKGTKTIQDFKDNSRQMTNEKRKSSNENHGQRGSRHNFGWQCITWVNQPYFDEECLDTHASRWFEEHHIMTSSTGIQELQNGRQRGLFKTAAWAYSNALILKAAKIQHLHFNTGRLWPTTSFIHNTGVDDDADDDGDDDNQNNVLEGRNQGISEVEENFTFQVRFKVEISYGDWHSRRR